jgi:hypothetical protein
MVLIRLRPGIIDESFIPTIVTEFLSFLFHNCPLHPSATVRNKTFQRRRRN